MRNKSLELKVDGVNVIERLSRKELGNYLSANLNKEVYVHIPFLGSLGVFTQNDEGVIRFYLERRKKHTSTRNLAHTQLPKSATYYIISEELYKKATKTIFGDALEEFTLFTESEAYYLWLENRKVKRMRLFSEEHGTWDITTKPDNTDLIRLTELYGVGCVNNRSHYRLIGRDKPFDYARFADEEGNIKATDVWLGSGNTLEEEDRILFVYVDWEDGMLYTSEVLPKEMQDRILCIIDTNIINEGVYLLSYLAGEGCTHQVKGWGLCDSLYESRNSEQVWQIEEIELEETNL